MALQARLRKIDGVDVIVAGPSESIKKENINDVVVPCAQVYEQNFDLLFPAYVGPTCTVKKTEDGMVYVEMLYTAVESDLASVKAQLISRINPIFSLIDEKSTRAVRAIIYANTTGNTPHAADIEVAKKCEEAAIANRAVIAKINSAESLQWLRDNSAELVVINPWHTDEYGPQF